MNTFNYPYEALLVIDDILKYGSTKHKSASWRKESMRHHLDKAHGHIHDFIYEIDNDEDHLACALTRMAMCISIREAERVKKFKKSKEEKKNAEP